MQAIFKLRNGPRSIPPKERKVINQYATHLTTGKSSDEHPVYLYVVYCKGYAKIGLTDTPKTRLSAMQGGNPFPLEMIYSILLKRKDAVAVEAAVLLALSDAHWLGDWFKTSRSHAKYVASTVAAKVVADRAVPVDTQPVEPPTKFPGMKRKVRAPDGAVFASCAEAAAFLGISRQAMYMRLKNQWNGWRYA
jgi:hypothetical protein